MLVAIEGLDGSGKSTLIRSLGRLLEERGIPFLITSEPTDGPIGKIIKGYLAKGEGERHVILEALMFAADRVWHLKEVVEPALKRGKIVLTDRYKYSSIAYQSGERPSWDWVEALNLFAPEADLALFLDVSPDACMERLRGTKRAFSVMEEKKTLWTVYRNYLEMVDQGRLVRISGDQDEERMAEEAFRLIMEKREER